MTRPLLELADELLSSEMGRYHEVVRAADAVLHASSEPDWCPLCADLEQDGQHDDECAMLLYQRAVAAWERMNAAREAWERDE